jgi:hypothetical protein
MEGGPMIPAIVPVLVTGVVLAEPPTTDAPNDQPTLVFTQDGEDLIVTAKVEIVDAPHVLWTHGDVVTVMDPYLLGPRHPPKLFCVDLYYEIIQSRDDPIILTQRHRKKQVEVKWRLPGHEKADVRYNVINKFTPSAEELLELAPRLVKLAEETKRRLDSPLGIP